MSFVLNITTFDLQSIHSYKFRNQISSPDSTSFLFSHGSPILSRRHDVLKLISGDCHLGCRSFFFHYFEKWCRRQSIVGTSLKVSCVGVLLLYLTLFYARGEDLDPLPVEPNLLGNKLYS